MDRTRLVNLASELIIKQIYSDLECHISTWLFDDDTFSIQLTHHDSRYDRGNKTLRIYEWQSDEQILSTFKQMESVLDDERLIENE